MHKKGVGGGGRTKKHVVKGGGGGAGQIQLLIVSLVFDASLL
jgi:hypothetical protein